MLSFDLDQNGPFIDRFVVQKAARREGEEALSAQEHPSRPVRRLEFAAQGKRTLIFSTQANWVESYGRQVVDLCKRGYLTRCSKTRRRSPAPWKSDKRMARRRPSAVACLNSGRRHPPWAAAKSVPARARNPAVRRRPKSHRCVANAVAGPQSERGCTSGPAFVSVGEASPGRSLPMSPAAPGAPSSMWKASSSTPCSTRSIGACRNGSNSSAPSRRGH